MRRLLAGLRALLRRREHEQDLDDELRAYLEAAIDQNIASGMSRDEAGRAARLTVGSIEATKDAVRDVGWESWLESVWRDVRYAFEVCAVPLVSPRSPSLLSHSASVPIPPSSASSTACCCERCR